MKTLLKLKFLLLAILCYSCGCSQFNLKNNAIHPTHLPKESFIFINTYVKLKVCNEFANEKICNSTTIGRFTGSGITVFNYSNGSAILTAEHVCGRINTESSYGPNPNHKIYYEYEIINYNGEKFKDISLLTKDENNDVCLMFVGELNSPSVKIAENLPELGERVFNLAAPLSIFTPGKLVLTFEGLYSGINDNNITFYTIPVQGGSSGSAILNSNNEIVGMIHSRLTRMESVGLSASLESIHNLVKNHSPD
jgi:hypothetical protein